MTAHDGESLDDAEATPFPVPRDRLFAMPSVYPRWREQCPVRRVAIRDGKRAWAVTRYDDVREVLNNDHLSANRRDPRFPNLRAGVVTLSSDSNLLHMNPPDHTRYRKMLLPEFTGRRVKALRPTIEQYANDAIDRLLASAKPSDFYEAVALPIPSMTICLLLGVDYREHATFEQLTKRLLKMTTSLADFHASVDKATEFMRGEVDAQAKNPGDGIIARLLERERAGEISHEQVVGFSMLILIGGHEATAKAITLGVISLLNEPDKATAIRNDPSLVSGAVEEALRIHSITDLTAPKLATEDITVGGCPIRAGDGIFPLIGSANHDPDVFPDPETFDPNRDFKGHLTFGAGPHVCIGQNFARVEMEAVFSAVLNRAPTLRLAVPVDQLELDREAIAWGVKALPVTW
jgi:pentalenic acid synthase